MKAKVILGSALVAAILGVGVLAGSVIGTGSVAAQTSSATPSATAVAPGTTNPPAGRPGDMGDMGGRGGMRGGPGGPGGPGGGHDGMDGGFGYRAATADGATQAITNAASLITLVKSDLAYATGKMDTADVQGWLDGADSLLKSAQSANSSSQYGQAVAYAQAARELASVADSQMAQKLGASTLPSHSQQPQRPDKGMNPNATTTTLTQAQASRILAETYNRLVTLATQVKNASNVAEATPYLTDAQNTYKTAYNAYQAGSYSDAASAARLAGQLAKVADSVVEASTAPANADTPVTVPAPNF